MWHMLDDTVNVWPNKALGCNHQLIYMPQLQPLCLADLVTMHYGTTPEG